MLEEMLLVLKAVVRGGDSSLIVADMPFLSYQPSKRDALHNAGQFNKLEKVPKKAWAIIERATRGKNKK